MRNLALDVESISFALSEEGGYEYYCIDDELKELAKNVRDMQAENAKLRELVQAFDWCTENFDTPNKCNHCPLPQSDALEPECEVRMRELRVDG